MDRTQFMQQLERLLMDISPAERREALEFYEGYFDEAGPENEKQVIRELGSPGKVAAIIKADLKEGSESYGQYTEKGYEDTRTGQDDQMPARYESRREEHNRRKAQQGHRSGRGSSKLVLLLILLVFLAPFITGAVKGILGVLITIALLPFIIIFAVGAGVVGLLIAALACMVSAIGLFIATPAVGVLVFGIGVLLAAISIALGVLFVYLVSRTLPALLRKITSAMGNMFQKSGKRRNEV